MSPHEDKFGVLSVQLAKSAVLALYASGRKTGIVLDSGLGETRAVPVCEAGWWFQHMAFPEVSGAPKALTKYTEQGHGR